MQDWLGRSLEVGTQIVYPGRVGSSQWMTLAVVLEVQDNALRVQPIRKTHEAMCDTKPVTLTAIDRVTVVEE